MSPSKILFFLCISFVLGIFLESVIEIPQIFLWDFLFADFFAIVIFLLIKKIFYNFRILFSIFDFGILRMQISEFNIANDKLAN